MRFRRAWLKRNAREEKLLPDFNDEQGSESSERPFWSGTITFGLVSIPVSLFPANRQSGVSLRMLGPNGKPLSRRYYSPSTDRELSAEQMVRGYEIEKGRYIVVTDEELDRLAPEKSRDIDLRRFVKESEIPPIYFERAYFLVPASGSAKAYRLLAATMEETRRAGIATFVMRGKEYLVAILSENGILRAETLRFYDEIRSPEDVGLPEVRKPTPAKVRRFETAISKLSADDISPNEMKDAAAEGLLELARKKQSRRQDVVKTAAAGKSAEVIDILTILQRSLGQARSRDKRSAADELTRLSRSELSEKAKRLNISGRSTMTKDELVKAIRRVA
jgi:DNA end-binding protein Ku